MKMTINNEIKISMNKTKIQNNVIEIHTWHNLNDHTFRWVPIWYRSQTPLQKELRWPNIQAKLLTICDYKAYSSKMCFFVKQMISLLKTAPRDPYSLYSI